MSELNTEEKERRTSPHCTSVRVRIVYTKRIVAIFLLLMLIVPLLYLIPSATTNVKMTVSEECTYEPFGLSLFNKTQLSYENITISIDESFTDWEISSIELYLNSYSRNVNITTMIQYVIYNQENPTLNSYNSMKINLFQSNLGYKIQNSNNSLNLNGYTSLTVCPVDYILSYLKLTLLSTNNNSIFSVDFYHFFQDESYTELKYSLSTEIQIKGLNFSITEYYNWYNWKYQNGTIPSKYPYIIDTTIRRYNGWNERLGVKSI